MRGKALVVLALAALLTPLAALPAQSTTYCFGMPTTMSVVPGGTTYGTAGDDVILGTAGNETIYGNGGKDRMCGGGGNDRLYGGAGPRPPRRRRGQRPDHQRRRHDQVLNGGAGNDTIAPRHQGYGDDTHRRYGSSRSCTVVGDDRLSRTGSWTPTRLGTTSSAPFRFVSCGATPATTDITSDYRNDLDAGVGLRPLHARPGVPGTGCERVTLPCGSGGEPLPAETRPTT